MAVFKLQEVAEAVGGELVNGDLAQKSRGVSTDTRAIKQGELFIALIGENFDGHTFIDKAFQQGAVAAIVSDRSIVSEHPDKAFIVADDTTKALQELASYHRRRFPKLRVVAVTGSNGKTTVKNMIAAGSSKRYKTLSTQGNLNNHIGLPLTLLRLTAKHEVAVVELGMNHKGEIARLSTLCAPDIGVITNVSGAHIGSFASIAGVRNAKGELLDALGPKGVAVLNADNKESRPLIKKAGAKAVTFGKEKGARVRMIESVQTKNGGSKITLSYKRKRHTIKTPLPGAHQLENSLAAFTALSLLGVEPEAIASALWRMKPEPMRMERIKLPSGALLINDTYNANPASVASALETLKSLSAGRKKGRLIFAFGQMEELGTKALAAHKKVGRQAALFGVDLMITKGALAHEAARVANSRGVETLEANNHRQVAKAIHKKLGPTDLALFKGSRRAKMEESLHHLIAMEGEA